jgi:hypothetical protein
MADKTWFVKESKAQPGKWAIWAKPTRERGAFEMTSFGVFGSKTTADLFNPDRPEHDQSMAYYEAKAVEDFARNAERNLAVARDIKEAYRRPSQEALDLAKRARVAAERFEKMTPAEFREHHAELERAYMRRQGYGHRSDED